MPFTAVTDSTLTAALADDTKDTVGAPAAHKDVPVSRNTVAPAAKFDAVTDTVGMARTVATMDRLLLIPYTLTIAEIVRPM